MTECASLVLSPDFVVVHQAELGGCPNPGRDSGVLEESRVPVESWFGGCHAPGANDLHTWPLMLTLAAGHIDWHPRDTKQGQPAQGRSRGGYCEGLRCPAPPSHRWERSGVPQTLAPTTWATVADLAGSEICPLNLRSGCKVQDSVL